MSLNAREVSAEHAQTHGRHQALAELLPRSKEDTSKHTTAANLQVSPATGHLSSSDWRPCGSYFMSSPWQRSKVRLPIPQLKWLQFPKIRKPVCSSGVFTTASMQGLKNRHPGVHPPEISTKGSFQMQHASPRNTTFRVVRTEDELCFKDQCWHPNYSEEKCTVFLSESRGDSETERWVCRNPACWNMSIKWMSSIVSSWVFSACFFFFCIFICFCPFKLRTANHKQISKKARLSSSPMENSY